MNPRFDSKNFHSTCFFVSLSGIKIREIKLRVKIGMMKCKMFFVWTLVVIVFIMPLRKGFAQTSDEVFSGNAIRVGAENTEMYIDLLRGKKVGVIANQASLIGERHLVDSLIGLGIKVRAIYCPEHGFRGDAEAGAIIKSSIDDKTSLPIISLYGNNKKPKQSEFRDNEVVVFDLQDVGTRFYTYISTLHYVMEACVENNILLIVLDRPNPNASYIDGAVLKDSSLVSFVGMHPVPIVYGMTIGEYAKMINGELWLGTSNNRVKGEKGNLRCDLTIIPIKYYNHSMEYSLPIAPSPNLKTPLSVLCYPSLCFFEGTPVSVGRGTDCPFEIVGYPEYNDTSFSFTPKVIKGVSDNPPYKNIMCYGESDMVIEDCIKSKAKGEMSLSVLIRMYNAYPNKDKFFQNFFDKLAGTKDLKLQVRQGMQEQEIRKTWAKDIEEFKQIRKKYLIYD